MAIKQEFPDWVGTEKDRAAQALFAEVADFDKNVGSTVSTANLNGIRAYTGRGYSSLSNTNYMNDLDMDGQLGLSPSVLRVAFNITAVSIDTLTAKLANIDTVATAVTNKATAKGRLLAEQLNYVIQGIYHKFNVRSLLINAFRDAMINRAGYVKICQEYKKNKLVDLKIERIYPDEVIVDPADGYYNNPYKMIHRKIVPVSVLVKMYPKYKAKIEGAKVIEVRQTNTQNYTPSIQVIEAWCRNSYVEGGRHVICIENCTFVDEEYDKDHFPIIKVDYTTPVIGSLGQSVVDELAPLQREIDRILVTMQAIMKQVSIPRVFIDTKSQVNKNFFTNKIGIMIPYDGNGGNAPIIHNGAAMPPELPKQLEFLIAQSYARVGLTTMDTQGQKPSGLQSGEALQMLSNKSTERWAYLEGLFKDAHINFINILLKELAGTPIKLSALDDKIGLMQITGMSIPVDAESYAIQMFPISSLPSDPAGRVDAIEKYIQLGVLKAENAIDLLQLPDLGSEAVLLSAPRKYIDVMLETMLDTGEYVFPEPYDNLDYGVTRATEQYAWQRIHEKDEKKLVLLRRYLNDCQQLIAQRSLANVANQPTPVPSSPSGQQPIPGK